jgi:hypothetical protein
MQRYSQKLNFYSFIHGIGGLLVALVCAVTLAGCASEPMSDSQLQATGAGSLALNVNPDSARIVVTDLENYTKTFTGNFVINDLAPGQYMATVSAKGFADAISQINVVAGQTATVSLALQATTVIIPRLIGSLNININPAAATVTVTGPQGFKIVFIGNQFITDLTPGVYKAMASAPGFADAVSQINVVANQTSSMLFLLQATPIISESPRAVYRDGKGNLIPLDSLSIQSGQFLFYAWLQDESMGIITTDLLTSTIDSDPGQPLLSEQMEIAPSFTQNLAASWVGFMDENGIVRPVIGADVRWEIDQMWSERINSMQFGTSDDNRIALGYGVFDDQADTRTNNANLDAERFPLVASEYPLYNQTGIGTPYVDGFTWVTLFSADARAAARIIAVATINGEEIGKQILYKEFAATPKLEIIKTVDTNIVNLANGKATATWTVVVKNVGTGDADNIDLSDGLASGAATTYALTSLPTGSIAVGDDGFTYSFPLESAYIPGQPKPMPFLGNADKYAVLAMASVTNTGSSVVSGNVGVSAGSSSTGFPPGLVLNGMIHNNDSDAQSAQIALKNAYNALADQACTAPLNTPLSNATLKAGVYCYDSSASLAGPLVLDGQSNPAAKFIFKISSALTTGVGSSIKLINGASPCNVFWTVGSSATLGTNSFFAGNILAKTSITAGTNATISGRTLAQTGMVTLSGNSINAPLSCFAAPGSMQILTFKATVTAPGTYCNKAEITSYSDENDTWKPIDLKAQACFTALESKLSIIKDFVADDNTTSLGKSLTVAASVPAKLRLQIINSGTGAATGVTVNDKLTSGTLANYKLISVSSGTPNSTGGFDTTIGNLAAGASTTLLFTVAASVDGVYCDTATVKATSGIIGIGSDKACLTVATPELTIEKINTPHSVLPSGSYTSTIVVKNIGNAPAKNVLISDLLGLNSDVNVRAIYVSSSLNGVSGTLANNIVTAPYSVEIAAGASITFTVVSRIPFGAVSGTYCNTATVISSNAATKQDSDCIDVPAFSALQTSLVDLADPIAVGSNVTYFSTLYVEALSNEGVNSNKLTYSFGLVSPTTLGIPGVFKIVSTNIYLDSKPVRDPVTGLVISDTSNPTAVLLTLNTDYTLDNSILGLQRVVMTPSFVLLPDTCFYLVHVAQIPTGTPTNKMYTTSYIWDSVGLVNPANKYQASSSEPTTVLP